MSKVGDLYYEILFKDGTDKGLKNIEDKIKKLNTQLSVGIDENKLVQNIQAALSKQSFQIKVNASVSGLDNIGKQMEQIASSAATAMANAANGAQKKGGGTRKSSSKPVKDTFKSEWPQNPKFIQSTKSSEENLRRMRRGIMAYNGLYSKYGNIGNKMLGIVSLRNRNMSSGIETMSRYGKMVDQISSKIQSSAVSNDSQLKSGFMNFARQAAERAKVYQGVLHSYDRGSIWYKDTARSLAQKSTMSVTNIPAKGTEEYRAYQAEQDIRRASRRNEIREAFNEQAKAEKEKDALIKQAEKERASISKQNDAAELKRQRNLYAELSRQHKADVKAEKEKDALIKQAEKERLSIAKANAREMGALRSQGATAKYASRQATFAGMGKTGTAYASGMEDIRRKAIQSAWDIRGGRTPQYTSTQLSSMAQNMNSWMQQFNSMRSAMNSIGGQIGNMRQVAANNPGRAGAIEEQINALRNYRYELARAAVTYRQAMGGDTHAQSRIAQGMYSPQWLQQIQRNAKAAGDAVRQATSGMQVNNYAHNLRQVADELSNVQSRGSKVAEVLGGVFSVYAAKEFFDRLVQIGGEFEKQKLALASMFNSQTKADTLYSQIQSLAVKSPFTFGELTDYTKQMSAYGIQYKDIYDTTKRLADISAGVGVPMSRIILAYGQVSTAHFLRGQELRQFTEAGIPLVDALAKRFTKLKGEMVSADDVFTMISNRAVKFEDVKAVLDEMTDKGGRFYNMQDVLSESLSGKWSNLQDSIEIMYSEIENSNNGILKGIVEALTAIVRSWHTLLPIGAGLAAVFGALTVKQKLWNLLTTKASARDARMIADKNAMAEALARETEAYNSQTAAINANSSTMEKNALRRTGYRMALNGGDPNAIMANSNGLITKANNTGTRLFNYAALNKGLVDAQRNLTKANGLVGNLKASVGVLGARSKIAFAQMTLDAESFGAAIIGLISWTNAIMAGLFIGITWWTYHKQKVDEMNEHVRESIKGMKDTYNELNEFIKANPIELTIAEDNATKINELYKSYKDKIENAPIDLSFVISNAEQIQDVGGKLRYMRTELENLTFVTEQYQTIAAATTKAIGSATGGVFNDSLGENLKDYMDSVRDYEAEKMKLNNEDYQDAYIDAVNTMFRRLTEVDSKTRDSITSRWKQAAVEIKAALDKGDIEEYLSLINKWNTQNPQPQAQFDPYKYTSVSRKRGEVADDYDIMVADIKKSMPIIEAALRQGHEQIMDENGKIVEGESYTLNKLTDQGHMALLTLLQDYVNSGKWSKDEMEAYLAYIETKAKAAPGATWQTNTRMFHAFLDELKANYKKEFEGAEFTGKFSDSQNEAIQQAIHNLPIQFKPYEGKFLQQVKNMSQKAKGIIASVLGMTNAPGSGAMTEAEEAFDRLSKKPGRGGANWKKAYSIAAPEAGESYQDWIDRLSKSAVEYADKEYLYKNTKVRTASVEASQKQAANKKRQTIGVLWEINPVVAADTEAKFKKSKKDKKDAQARNKAESEANKEENERLKKLRDRMNRLQDIKNVYKKMAEIYGETDAIARMKKSDLFAADGIPDSVRGTDTLNTWIASELGKVHDKAGTKSEEQRNVAESALKSKIDIEIEIDRKQFDREVKQLDRDIKKTKEQWDRYMAFRELGVSQEQSVMLTFGDGSKPTTETDYRRQQAVGILKKNNIEPTNVDEILKMDKDQLSEYFMGNSQIVDQLAPVVEAYKEAWNEVVKKNDDMYKSLLENAKSYNDKIADLNEKYMRNDAAIEAGRIEYQKSGGKSGLSPQMVEHLRAANTQDYNKSVGEVQMDQLRNSESYLNFFNAVTSMTIDEAMRIGEAIQNQLTEKLADGTISAKDYADEIAKIQEQMDKVRNQKTLTQATLQGGLKGRVEWQKQNAQDRWNAANNAYGAARKEYDQAALKGDKDAMGKASQKMWWLNIQRGSAEKDEEKAAKREKKMNDISAGIGMFGSAADSLSKFRDSLGDTITSFGGDTSSAGFQTFSTVVDSVGALASGAQDVMQKMMSGDFVGAAFSAITAPLNVITAFNKLHDQKLQRQIELSEKRSAEIKAASDQIQHAIENSLGTDAAKENAKESYKQLGEQMKAAGVGNMGDSYTEIYKTLEDGSYIQKVMDGLKVNNTKSEVDELLDNPYLPQTIKNSLKSIQQKIVDEGTGGLKGKDYRNQEEYAALKKEGFDTTDSISAYGAQYMALLEQRKELESRMEAENDKKNTDKDKIADYRDQLSDLNNQIREFKDTMLKDILGLDFKTWADNLASNLVGAFKKGQDAAEALSQSVNDMLATITQNAIKNAVIMPYVNQLKEQIEDAYDINSPDSIDKVVDIIYGSEKTLVKIAEDAQKIWTETDRRTNGSLSKTSESSSGSTIQGSAKGLTEETGGLIASYLNAIRADVSFKRTMMEKLMKESLPKVDLVMEAQLKELSTISKNTALIVQNTEANAAAARSIKDTLGSVVTVGSGGKAIRIK